MRRWCTVTVLDAGGRRHSLDLVAESSYDAAHLYFAQAKTDPKSMLPIPTRETVFEVVLDGRVYRVPGERLREWIAKRRTEGKGPSGYLFKQRPVLD